MWIFQKIFNIIVDTMYLRIYLNLSIQQQENTVSTINMQYFEFEGKQIFDRWKFTLSIHFKKLVYWGFFSINRIISILKKETLWKLPSCM